MNHRAPEGWSRDPTTGALSRQISLVELSAQVSELQRRLLAAESAIAELRNHDPTRESHV